MKKPSDILRLNEDKQNDLEFEMWRIHYALREMGMSEEGALDCAELAVQVQELTKLKDELEGML